MREQIRIFKIIQDELSKRDLNLLKYGFELTMMSMLVWGTILFCSILLENFYETIVFYCAFLILRKNVGGYHAKSKWQCYIYSLLVYISFSAVLKYLPATEYRNMVWCMTVILFIMSYSLKYVVPDILGMRLMNGELYYISIVVCLVQNIIIGIWSQTIVLDSIVFSWLLGMFNAVLFIFIEKSCKKTRDLKRKLNNKEGLNINEQILIYVSKNKFIRLLMCTVIFIEINSACAGPFYEPEIPDFVYNLKSRR